MAERPVYTSNIVALTASGYRAAQYRLPEKGGLSHVMPVMGMRVFYGRLRDDSGVAQFCMTNRAFARAEQRARELCDLLWEGNLSSDTYEVEGRVLRVVAKVDLTPRETTDLAMRWGRAMGAF